MSHSYWGYWLVVMGVAIVGLMISVQGITTTTNQDYLSIKEITDASMLEAVDYAYYRDYNEVKINKEKFMEVFIRRLAEVMGNDTYEVNFYGIYEAPPKVSVEIKTNSGSGFATGYDTVSRLSAIIQIHAIEVGDSTNQNTNNNANGNSNNNNNSNSSDVKITNKEEADNLGVDSVVTFNVSSPSGSSCTWSSDNTGVATVNSNGKVTIHDRGVATVTVKCGNKSDSVKIIIDDSTGECSGWLESFTVNASNNKFEPGKVYTAKMVYIARPPAGRGGTCILKKSGIWISEAIGLNESTGAYNSTFEGDDTVEIDIGAGQEAKVEVEMQFKVPENYQGQEIKLRAYVTNSIEKEITLKR